MFVCLLIYLLSQLCPILQARFDKNCDIENYLGNLTYIQTISTKVETLDIHKSALCSFDIPTKTWSSVTLLDILVAQVFLLTVLYCWICQMLHESAFQNNLTYSSWAVKSCLHGYCDTSYFRGYVNQLFIQKISNDLVIVHTIKVHLLMH
jgi:hypothetical protein